MEKCYLSKMDHNYLIKIGLQENQISLIESLIQKGIKEGLYTQTKDFYHDLKHIERVITYAQIIINEKAKKGEVIDNQNLLLLAALYHDIGKSLGSSNKEHGIVGAKEVKKYLENELSPKEIDMIQRLIITHAQESDKVEFDNIEYTEEEKKNLQILSNILKDADALDRNRLNQPAPFGTCDVNKLRTEEAKRLLPKTDEFLFQYMTTIIKEKEKEKNQKILNNYNLLEEWINQYLENKKNGKEDKGFMFHASQDPSIEIMEPAESTQKGFYVYGGVDPVECFTMAAFRMSTLFLRTIDKETNQRMIIDVFPGTIEKTLANKYLTIYRLPEEQFEEYKEKVTSSPRREWVSTDVVKPIEEVTIPALEMLEFIKRKGLLQVAENSSKRLQLRQVLPGKQRIWNLKHQKDNPNYQSNKDAEADIFLSYYTPEFLPAIQATRFFMDSEIDKYNQEYFAIHHEYPDYSRKGEIHLEELQNRILPKIKSTEYLDDLCDRFLPQSEKKVLQEQELLKQQKEFQKKQQLLEQRKQLEEQKEQSNINQLTNQGPKLSLKKANGYLSAIICIGITMITGLILGIILLS